MFMWTTLGAGVRGLRRLVPRGLRPLPRLHLAVRGGLLGRGPPAPGGFGAGGSPSFMNAIHQVHLQSLLSEAEATGAPLPEGCLLFSSFFCRCCRARGGVESSAITAKWNGKSSASSFSTCDAYNNNTGREHQARHVLPDGTCRYKHACDKSRTRGLLANTFRLTLALLALTPTAAMPSSSEGAGSGLPRWRSCARVSSPPTPVIAFLVAREFLAPPVVCGRQGAHTAC